MYEKTSFYWCNLLQGSCKELAVLEKAACKAGKAGTTLPSFLPHCATQCCVALLWTPVLGYA
jgi:hypothetical protein